MSVNPYQFEPTNKNKRTCTESDDEWEDVDENIEDIEIQNIDINQSTRLNKSIDIWCKCLSCRTMPVNRECLCCTEIDEIKFRKLSPEVKCITQHEGFEAVCLNRYVLWAAMVSLNDREGSWLPPENNIPNRTYRYAAYRQFSWFIYTKLGRYVRRIIPACAVCKIRDAFPEADGNYVNFEGEDEGANAVSELVEAWEYLGGFDEDG